MKIVDRKTFLKYRLLPLVIYFLAVAISVVMIQGLGHIANAGAKDIYVLLMAIIGIMIITVVMIWGVALSCSQDAQSKELRDMIRKLQEQKDAQKTKDDP